MKRKLLLPLGVITILLSGFFGVFSNQTFAVQCSQCSECHESFLGFQAWYSGIELKDCKNASIDSEHYKQLNNGLAVLVWTIILNVMLDISIAIGILATGFVMYGGYLYIFSQGSPDKAAKGKITIRNAIIGIVIAVAAGVIVGTIKTILTSP